VTPYEFWLCWYGLTCGVPSLVMLWILAEVIRNEPPP
jgi:hypothetical protein